MAKTRKAMLKNMKANLKWLSETIPPISKYMDNEELDLLEDRIKDAASTLEYIMDKPHYG